MSKMISFEVPLANPPLDREREMAIISARAERVRARVGMNTAFPSTRPIQRPFFQTATSAGER
jgi:hypothetical protein